LIIWNPGPSVDLTEMTQFGPWIYFHLIIRLRKRMGTGLTVLKYSIDLMILPFSSGINNIPNASLALNCQIASLQDSQSLNEKEYQGEGRRTAPERTFWMQLLYGFSSGVIQPG
jgi:hypothetical protein